MPNDEKYDKYLHKYTKAQIDHTIEYVKEKSGKIIDRREAVEWMEKNGIGGVSKKEWS